MKNLGGWERVVFKLCKLGLPPFPNNRNPLLKTLMVTSTGKGVQANIYECSTKFHIDFCLQLVSFFFGIIGSAEKIS